MAPDRVRVLADARTEGAVVRSGETAVFPVVVRGTRLAELQLFAGQGRLSGEDRATLELLASEAAVVVQSVLLLEETRALSRIDPLTGLPNRRTCVERLQQELSRIERYGDAISVAVCDIDHFKRVNDTYGHNMG